ncbi:hypothetical protein [Pontibacter cellulosilyticus]|uniref:Uncharacterized protein n=1 Tax=Pontibacter cellulosilyticus TaxID=1720253 RepID=A0A923SLG0_9BACT|nr:hypothetical protein [Pontibacter cellulosilyticus]MBC5994841.1 hypothetical protein [Pontibacter cellulosilyticus]
MSKQAITNGIIDFIFLIAVTALFYHGYNSFSNQEEHINNRVIVVNFWNLSNSLPFDSLQRLPFDSHTGTFKKIYFTGIEKSDSLKMIEIKEALTNFNARKDEGPGVQIVFGDSSKYGDFIKVLDYCSKESIRHYLPYKNSIWIPAKENLTK